MFYGLWHLPWWGYPLVLLVLTHITIVCVTVFFHRHQAHRALDLHASVSHFFRFWLWLTTGMVTKEWASIHRKHHAKCETEEDPHSPQILSLPTVLWKGTELYRKESRDPETLLRYGQGTPDDAIEKILSTPNPTRGIHDVGDRYGSIWSAWYRNLGATNGLDPIFCRRGRERDRAFLGIS